MHSSVQTERYKERKKKWICLSHLHHKTIRINIKPQEQVYGGPLFSERKDGKVTEIFSHHLGGHIVAKDEMLQQIKKARWRLLPLLSFPPSPQAPSNSRLLCVCVVCPVYMKREPGLRFQMRRRGNNKSVFQARFPLIYLINQIQFTVVYRLAPALYL